MDAEASIKNRLNRQSEMSHNNHRLMKKNNTLRFNINGNEGRLFGLIKCNMRNICL